MELLSFYPLSEFDYISQTTHSHTRVLVRECNYVWLIRVCDNIPVTWRNINIHDWMLMLLRM